MTATPIRAELVIPGDVLLHERRRWTIAGRGLATVFPTRAQLEADPNLERARIVLHLVSVANGRRRLTLTVKPSAELKLVDPQARSITP